VDRGEGKIKADGTILRHRAQNAWSAHWLGEGARHRSEAGVVPRLGQTLAFVGLLAALHLGFRHVQVGRQEQP
jgi:hypothetical protein